MDEIKGFSDVIISFIKGLMQPIITIFALYVGASLIAEGKVTADQAWLIPVGVIAYWFADKSGIWDTLFGKAKSSGESPKASSGTQAGSVIATLSETPANVGSGQNWASYAEQKAANDASKTATQTEVAKFDRADFDQKVTTLAKNTLSWSDLSPASLYNAAVTVYWGMFPLTVNVNLDMINTLIEYAESAFMQIFELDSAKWTPQTYMTWLNTPADKCGGVCKPPITEGKKTLLVRLGDYYATRAELESKLGK